ncbi:thiamine phosphate synthase [Flavobacterium gilvum]|uniref:Thiamine phosphate synthase n=1 Tax=Flavobacterium gilvum TaxID=1492737 RepID=A0AAC9I742_9FLAO|nr:thiamine phosphate synthase [Flavobacterium gilvum]AOW09122.1 thiamine phosphate synthase [Flavobacterium gilvum]KFC60232.1 thiamine monophosphate synthase [Flavobacterium gilvum]
MIVITNPFSVKDEIDILHTLFEEGLELLHIRKPDFSEGEMKSFLSEIKSDWRQRLVLHSHHQLAEDFGINRIHFTEKNREINIPNRFSKPVRSPFTASTSTHSIEDFNALDTFFDYAFLSPVFPSISKENYQSETDLFEAIKKRKNFKTKLIALGGIEANNLKYVLETGFNNVALLGTIWKTNKPIENFKLCQKIVLSY